MISKIKRGNMKNLSGTKMTKDNQAQKERLWLQNYSKYWQIKKVDESVVIGMVWTVFIGWCSWFKADEFKFNDEGYIAIFLISTIIIYFVRKLVNSKVSAEEEKYIVQKVPGNISSAILLMYRSGLILKTANQNVYLFKTRNLVLPNDSFLVMDCNDHCTLIGDQSEFKRLRINLDLCEKPNGSKDDNTN
jgi:hypothetical protein